MGKDLVTVRAPVLARSPVVTAGWNEVVVRRGHKPRPCFQGLAGIAIPAVDRFHSPLRDDLARWGFL